MNLIDFIPPIAPSYLKERTAAASVTWMLKMLVEDVSALPLDGWRVDAHNETAIASRLSARFALD